MGIQGTKGRKQSRPKKKKRETVFKFNKIGGALECYMRRHTDNAGDKKRNRTQIRKGGKTHYQPEKPRGKKRTGDRGGNGYNHLQTKNKNMGAITRSLQEIPNPSNTPRTPVNSGKSGFEKSGKRLIKHYSRHLTIRHIRRRVGWRGNLDEATRKMAHSQKWGKTRFIGHGNTGKSSTRNPCVPGGGKKV